MGSSSDAGLLDKPGETSMQLYHGSNETISEIKNEGVFGGLFASTDKDVALSHADELHIIELEESEILTQQELSYHVDSNKVKKILSDNLGEMTDEELDEIYDAVIEDRNLHRLDMDEQRLLDIFYSGDLGEASWEAQKMRGIIAKNLGYKAVEMRDEHGTTYLVLPGVNISR
jgi:hypothetical protein